MEKNKLTLALAITCALFTASVHAGDPAQGFYLAPSFSYINYNSTYDLGDGAGGTFALGYQYDSPWSAEIAILMAESQFKNNITSFDGEHYQLRLDGLYHFSRNKDVHPYMVAGLGHGLWEFDNDTENNQTQLNAGIGLMAMVTKPLALRSDFRIVYDIDEGEINNILNVGLSYFFGSGKKAKPAAVVFSDKDGDSVADNRDQCPNTPANAPVSNNGCPKDSDNDGIADYLDKCPGTATGNSVSSTGCPKDSDNDGIADSLDKCPGTATGSSVSSTGCTKDSDDDGIADSQDRCSATPAGAKVDKKGCRVKLKEAIRISMQLDFRSGSANVLPEHYSEITNAGEFMRQYPDSQVVIEGHSDSQGAAAFNKRLSQQRANSVREYLINMYGIKATRIRAKGFGESSPIADNSTAQGRAKNRRVVAVIKGTVLR